MLNHPLAPRSSPRLTRRRNDNLKKLGHEGFATVGEPNVAVRLLPAQR
jgi:hypothetical protein